LAPLIRALSGRADVELPRRTARLGTPWPANDQRDDYLRATLTLDEADGMPEVSPLASQDSSLVSVLQRADCLVIRPPFAPAARAGDLCRFIDLRQAGF
jgi:molybdopterin molybdotransferase